MQQIIPIANSPAPDDAEYEHKGAEYKVGSHGLLFIWTGAYWKRSTRSLRELLGEIDYLANRRKALEVRRAATLRGDK